MVLAACRRVLTSHEDAEDAFQAVFLVLARRARSVRRGTALPAWLHRVAVRIATRLARSRKTSARITIEPSMAPSHDPLAQAEVLGALDEEVNRLPERFRRAVVLCYLDGLTAAEAAQQLGCPTGTVESRLATARKRLRERLTRRGIALPAGILAMAGQAMLAPEAVARVVHASAAFARGGAIANGTTAQLAKRVLVMWQIRKWAGAAMIAGLLLIGAGIGWASLKEGPLPNPYSAIPLATASMPQAKESPPPSQDDWPFARRKDRVGGTLVGIAPDGRTLVLWEDRHVYGLDLAESNKWSSPTFIVKTQNPINDATVSPDGKYIATAEGIHGVKLRDAATGKIVEAFWPSSQLPSYQVAFSQDGTRLIALGTGSSGSDDAGRRGSQTRNEKTTYQAQVSVWNLVTRKEVGYPVESTMVKQSVEGSVSAPSYQLGENGRFVLKSESMAIAPKPNPGEGPGRYSQRSGEPAGFRFTIIDTETGKSSRPVEVKDPNLFISRPFSSRSLSPDAKTIVAWNIASQNQIRLIDTATGKESARLTPLLRPIQAITFSADGKLVAASSGRSQTGEHAQLAAPSEVVIWEVASGKELARVTDKESIRDYSALRFSPDGKFLVVQDHDGSYSFWGRAPKPAPAPPVEPNVKKEPSPPATGTSDRFQTLLQALSADGLTDTRRIEGVFLAALGRLPTDVESRTLAAQFARQTDKAAALRDLLTTLVSTDEFKAHAAALGKLSK